MAIADVTAFILTGGRSTRMGIDKAFVTLGGRTLLARALDLARSVAGDVQIVGAASKFATFGFVVEDIFPNCGPLGGIHAALRASSADLNLVLAVDTPFVPPDFLRFLIGRSQGSTALATVPRNDKGWQPLCAVYRRAFADLAESALQRRQYKIDALFDAHRTHVLTKDDLNAAGFSAEMFRNLNTPEELAEARKLPISTPELHRSFAAKNAAQDDKRVITKGKKLRANS